jgi:hypothetical protein
MNSQDIRALQESYNQVYELDEVRGGGRIDPVSNFPHHGERARSPEDAGLKMSPIDRAEARANALKKRGNPEATKRANRIQSRFVGPTKRGIGRAIDAANAARTNEKKRLTQAEDYDLYDIVLSHLLDEGYADTEQAAQVIMVNMGEDWREEIVEGMDMKDFKANRRNIKRREDSTDAKSRGHVSKNIVTHGKTYSSDEAKSRRANMNDNERATRKSVAMNPDQVGDTRETADKTKNQNKLRKQKAMGELG